MNPKKFKCVFSDLDKTLLNSNHVISEHTKEVLGKLISWGINFIPSSGRAFNSLPKDLFEIRGLKYAVTSNGVSVNDIKSGKVLFTTCIKKEDLEGILNFISGLNPCTEIFIGGQGYCSRNYWLDPSIAGKNIADRKFYVRQTRKPLDDYDEFVKKNIGAAEAFDIIAEPEKAAELMEELKKNFPNVYITRSENFLIEISSSAGGKHSGMERCCKLLEIEQEECIAFGDANNDMEMLSRCGLGIAVANATDECKAASDFVSSWTNNQDAVAKELEKIFSL